MRNHLKKWKLKVNKSKSLRRNLKKSLKKSPKRTLKKSQKSLKRTKNKITKRQLHNKRMNQQESYLLKKQLLLEKFQLKKQHLKEKFQLKKSIKILKPIQTDINNSFPTREIEISNKTLRSSFQVYPLRHLKMTSEIISVSVQIWSSSKWWWVKMVVLVEKLSLSFPVKMEWKLLLLWMKVSWETGK